MPEFYSKLLGAKEVFTFRDFILLPGLSEVEPSQVDVATRLTPNIPLNLPFVSSPMDTVTELDMAVAMARQGGIGIVHRNMTVEEQVEIIRRVKRTESFIIKDVYTTSPVARISDAVEIMSRHDVSGMPVVEDEKVVGIVTKRDVTFADPQARVKEVMTAPVITAGPSVTMEEARRIMHQHRIEKLPVVDGSNHLIGLVTVKDIYSRERYSTASRDKEGRLLVGAAISPFDLERAKILDRHADVLVSDVAHFHNSNILTAAARLVKEISTEFVIGNLGTVEAVEDSVSKIDRVAAVRAGVGSGSICVTAEVTKSGAPTLFAVAQAAEALNKLGMEIPVIADGGIRSPGDAALALAAGASCVMMGNTFAGCTESPGGLIKVGGKYYKPYRGMGSPSARSKMHAVDRYQISGKAIAEGVEGVVPYRGDVQSVVSEFESGLKAAFGYSGAKGIRDLWSKAKFGLVSAAGSEELKPHNIILPGEEKA